MPNTPESELTTETESAISNSVAEQTELTLGIIPPDGAPGRAAFRLTSTGLVIQPDLSQEEWVDGLKLFKWARTSLDAGFATYIAYGELHFGKIKVEECLAQLEFDMPMVSRAVAINSIPDELKHENLTSEHYIVLAKAKDITKAQQKKWARVASEQGLTPPQLRASIDAGEVVNTSTVNKNKHGIISIHGIAQEYDIWLRRVKGVEGILQMPLEYRTEIVGLLEEMVKLYHAVKESVDSATAS